MSKLKRDAIKIRIKSNDGEIFLKEHASSIIFASVVDSDKNSHKINAGMAGEFNMKTILRSVEAVVGVSAKALQEHHDITAVQFVEIMAKVVSSAVDSAFSDQDQNKAILHAIMELAKINSKN